MALLLQLFRMLLDFFNKNIFHLRGDLYLTDLLDIAIIGLLIYTFFIFFRRTRAYMVFLGLSITFGLYILSKNLNLYLTFITLRYFTGVSLIIFVIIFQNEIRKYFEFLGLIGSRQMKVGKLAPKSPSTSEIIQSCVRMAQEKIGALIVIQGKDTLDPHIDGGTPLDGVISEDVILSIFDPHSDGHDGALIIRYNRISKFSAHLPLSTNFKEIGKHGTRHSAALGLSEITDALCIVSSEERGQLSISKDGKLKTLTQYADLEKEIDRYIKAKFDPASKSKTNFFRRHDFALKFGAVVFAALIWFFTAYQAGIIEKSFNVPITVSNIPKNILVENYNPKTIRVTVSGRGDTIFSSIAESDFKIDYDATNITGGLNKETVSKKNIDIPANLSLVSIEPNSFFLTAKKFYVVKVPVVVRTTGSVTPDLQLTSVVVTPEEIEVWVPEETPAPTEILTEELDVTPFTESTIIPVKMISPEGIRFVDKNIMVSAALTIEKTDTATQ
ncbi:MAG: putative membrane protein [candidate division WWE3 bacterium GW2011_GWA1_41_8]|uniref:Diadenylate cyclase n=1 Tax=candidate division WWE3 bacterium GW2011_GWA1_41_8 TaxID=1619103 RepID=A0A0G0XB84_UNCKA|nr:MAG: putative membrane protein [candidate division WWE3 bacterium GW2011_GWA1_41_8]